MRKTTASLFTGGGGFEVGAMMAGYKPVWGVEIRADIAAVAERNIPGLRVIVSDVAAVDYTSLPKVDHLHASPSCKNASGANSEGEESPEDLAAAEAICRALREVGPATFTLENVWAYRDFEAFKLVVRQLTRLGYFVDWWHLNAADYGTPQTRKRLILIACLDRQPRKPVPTHSKTPDPWGLYKPWVGWLEAIADLVDTLPDSEFAPWQLARLPAELRTLLINGAGNTNFEEAKPGKGCRYEADPAQTVTTVTKDGGQFPKALLLAQGGYEGQIVNRLTGEPAFTVTSNSNQAGVRAYLVSSIDSTTREESEPSNTVVAVGDGHSIPPRAFLLNRNKSERDDHYKPEQAPAYTVCVESAGRQRALLIPGDNASNGVVRQEGEPMVTVQSRGLGQCPHRAFTGGRVVKMTPRALARFMSIPDSYLLPSQNGLACEIIGNAVCPLLAKAICESLEA